MYIYIGEDNKIFCLKGTFSFYLSGCSYSPWSLQSIAESRYDFSKAPFIATIHGIVHNMSISNSEITSGPKSGTFSSAITPMFVITSDRSIGSANYHSWSRSVKLCFRDQGYKEHLTTKVDVPYRTDFMRVDVLLCTILWQSIDPKLLHIYQAHKTCSGVSNRAKSLYTNDSKVLFCSI